MTMRVTAKWTIFLLISLVFLSEISSTSASPPVKIAAGVVSNVASALFKWLWSLNTPAPKTHIAIPGRSMIKFEGGYAVETVFDGRKLGIDPYSIEVSPNGELIILDSVNSNVHKVSSPLSKYSRPKLLTGSLDGYTGHVDGKLREAKMHQPKGLAVDDRGNIYIADTMNMAVRKISDSGVVTTIAGGRMSRGSHVNGPSEDAKFSDDFDVTYVRSSCSLLIVDRGSQVIREMQLQYDDCNVSEQPQSQDIEDNFNLGIVVLLVVGFFGYMMALLQQRVRALFSPSQTDPRKRGSNMGHGPYHIPHKPVIPPLIPNDEELEETEEGFFTSFGRLIYKTISTCFELLGALFTMFGNKKQQPRPQQLRAIPPHLYHQPIKPMNQIQDSYIIQEEDEPPAMETRSPTKDAQLERFYQTRQVPQGFHHHHGRVVEDEYHQNQNLQHYRQQEDHHRGEQQGNRQSQMQPQRHYKAIPTNQCCERGAEANEILFGAVQEQDGRRETVVIKAVDYSEAGYNHHNIRPRLNYMGYSSSYNY
ncbi:hypothetical protein V2J09_001286 [Rumex salicifolius]